jgi:hypothetical protein
MHFLEKGKPRETGGRKVMGPHTDRPIGVGEGFGRGQPVLRQPHCQVFGGAAFCLCATERLGGGRNQESERDWARLQPWATNPQYEGESQQYHTKGRIIMKKQSMWMLVVGLMVATGAPAQAAKWAIKADYTESCCCKVACPCVFGSSPSMAHCEDIGLIEIKEGHYGDVRLDGISVITTVRIGEWVKYSVDKDATDAQLKAAQQLIAEAFRFPATWKVLSTERAPVSVARTATKIKYSVPASSVEIERMEGLDGKPIKIQNLPNATLVDYTNPFPSATRAKTKRSAIPVPTGLLQRWIFPARNEMGRLAPFPHPEHPGRFPRLLSIYPHTPGGKGNEISQKRASRAGSLYCHCGYNRGTQFD